MEFLTTYTRDGTVFPVDARLRPQGSEGELVTTAARLAQYFSREAQAWEALSYLRLRLIAGDTAVAERCLAAVREGIALVARRPAFSDDLRQMRSRLEASDPGPNFKMGVGGAYDIDFLVGQFQARHGLWIDGTLSERIALALKHRMIEEEDARTLSHSAEFLRAVEHFVRLVTGHPGKWLPTAGHAHSTIAKFMSEVPGYREGQNLEEALTSVLSRTRKICLKYHFD
jgi:glutamate-ammonia-ligase adenylyltransferase